MQKFNEPVQNLRGDTIAFAPMLVLLAGTETPASIFLDAAGETPIAAPRTDRTGVFGFYAPNGRYDVYAIINGVRIGHKLDLLLYDPADAGGGDLASLNGAVQALADAAETTSEALDAVQATLQETIHVSRYYIAGAADWSTAFQNAINAAPDNAEIVGPGGVCVIGSEISITGKRNLTFRGRGTKVRGSATRFRSYFKLNGCTDVRFTGWTFDQMQPTLPLYTLADFTNGFYNCPINANASAGTAIDNCHFDNLYTVAVSAYACDGLTIADSTFHSPVQAQNQRMEHVYIQSCSGRFAIVRNKFTNAPFTNSNFGAAGLFVSGLTGSLIVQHNTFDYCGRDNSGHHRLGVVDVYGDAQNVRIINNIATNCMGQFSRVSAVRSGVVGWNRISMNPNADPQYSVITVESVVVYSPGQVGCQDIEVVGNVLEDLGGVTGFGIGVGSYDWGSPATNVSFDLNTFVGFKRAIYCYGPFRNLRITRNEARAGRGQIYVEMHEASNVPTSITGTEANSMFEDLVIEHNNILDESGSGASAINVLLTKADNTPYAGKIGRISICKNKARATVPSAGQGIAVSLYSTALQGRVSIADNETDGYAYDWFVRGVKELRIEGNRAINTGTSPYLDDGSNGTVLQRRNRYSTGAREGKTTLSGGTVTISTAEIRSGDTVLVTRTALGGTAGHLSVASVVNATSFVINSSSATDTSAVYWEIVH